MKGIKIKAILSSFEGIIGDGDKLAIYDKQDLQHFRKYTMNKWCIMGRTTVESLPKKLDGRTVVCLTTDKTYTSDKADYICTSLHQVDTLIRENNVEEIVVCGGKQVYDLFVPFIDEWCITRFEGSIAPIKKPVIWGKDTAMSLFHGDIIKTDTDSLDNGCIDYIQTRK